MAKFRKKPVTIEAIQWLGERTGENGVTFLKWLRSLEGEHEVLFGDNGKLRLKTPKGIRVAHKNDFIVCSVDGELYSYKPDVFELTYEPIEEGN